MKQRMWGRLSESHICWIPTGCGIRNFSRHHMRWLSNTSGAKQLCSVVPYNYTPLSKPVDKKPLVVSSLMRRFLGENYMHGAKKVYTTASLTFLLTYLADICETKQHTSKNMSSKEISCYSVFSIFWATSWTRAWYSDLNSKKGQCKSQITPHSDSIFTWQWHTMKVGKVVFHNEFCILHSFQGLLIWPPHWGRGKHEDPRVSMGLHHFLFNYIHVRPALWVMAPKFNSHGSNTIKEVTELLQPDCNIFKCGDGYHNTPNKMNKLSCFYINAKKSQDLQTSFMNAPFLPVSHSTLL